MWPRRTLCGPTRREQVSLQPELVRSLTQKCGVQSAKRKQKQLLSFTLTCVSLLAAPASVRSSCGSYPGGCCICIAARSLCAPLAQVPQPRVVSLSTYLHGTPWCPPSMPVQVLSFYVLCLCCLRCFNWAFWAAWLRPLLSVRCMCVPRSIRLLCVLLEGWHALRRALGILFGVTLLRGQLRAPGPLARVQSAPRRPMMMTTRRVVPALSPLLQLLQGTIQGHSAAQAVCKATTQTEATNPETAKTTFIQLFWRRLSSDSTPTSDLVRSDSSERGSSTLASPAEPDVPGNTLPPPAPILSTSGPGPRHSGSFLAVCTDFVP